jgi:hypothetical protein
MNMEREFESYNKNIYDFDARNIFEFDELKELNKLKFQELINREIENPEKTLFLNRRKRRRFSIN